MKSNKEEMLKEFNDLVLKYNIDFVGLVGRDLQDCFLLGSMCPVCAHTFLAMFIILNNVQHNSTKELGVAHDCSDSQVH